MLFLILFLVVFAFFTLGPIIFLRWLGSGRRPVLVVVQSLNTTGLLLTAPNTEVFDEKTGNPVRVNDDGGNFVRIIHTVEGKVLIDTDPDPMNHYLEDETKAGRGENKNIFFRWFGLRFISLFRYVRINSVRTNRWGRKDEEETYSMQPKTGHPLYPEYSVQHDMTMNDVETGGVLRIELLRFNFTLEEKYPYRVRKRTADAYAQFTIMVNSWVVSEMSAVAPMKFIGVGLKKAEDDLKRKLLESLMSDEFKEFVVSETGLDVRKASLPDFRLDPNTRELLEGPKRAELAGKAAVITATKARDARLKEIEAEAKYVQDVILPTAKDDRAVSVHWSQTWREQKAVHTLVTGQGVHPMLPLPVGSDAGKDQKDKAEKPKS